MEKVAKVVAERGGKEKVSRNDFFSTLVSYFSSFWP
jgi:hypothetical protein